MNLNTKKFTVLVLPLLGGAAAMALSIVMRTTQMDENGLIDRGAWAPIAIFAVLGIVTLALALLCRRLQCAACDWQTLRFDAVDKVSVALLGLAILVSCGWNLSKGSDAVITLASNILGLLAGAALLCQLFAAKHRPHFLTMLPICVWMIFRLIDDYQLWSRDPVLMNYCFGTLADVCAMLAVYHIAGFFLGCGKARRSIFWCGMTLMLTIVSVGDTIVAGNGSRLPVLLGLLLWLLVWAIRLIFCRDEKPQEEKLADEA